MVVHQLQRFTTLVADVDDGAMAVQARAKWKISEPSVQYCYELKTALKK